MKSTITNPSERELEMVANIEHLALTLKEAAEYVQYLGGDSHAIGQYLAACNNVNHYLNQHGVNIVSQ